MQKVNVSYGVKLAKSSYERRAYHVSITKRQLLIKAQVRGNAKLLERQK